MAAAHTSEVLDLKTDFVKSPTRFMTKVTVGFDENDLKHTNTVKHDSHCGHHPHSVSNTNH